MNTLTPQQTEIFLTNAGDFILTRGFFYSRKTYEGLEDYANNLDETVIGQLLVPKEVQEKAQEQRITDKEKWFRKKFSLWISPSP